MGIKERVKWLEKSPLCKGHEVLVRYVFPDDYPGEIPHYAFRASDVPRVPDYVRYYYVDDGCLCLPERNQLQEKPPSAVSGQNRARNGRRRRNNRKWPCKRGRAGPFRSEKGGVE